MKALRISIADQALEVVDDGVDAGEGFALFLGLGQAAG